MSTVDQIADVLVHVLPWLIAAWAARRAGYMNGRTSHVDRVAIVILGAGALAEGLMPLYQDYERWIDATFYLGVSMWCIAPSVRSYLRERKYRRPADTQVPQ